MLSNLHRGDPSLRSSRNGRGAENPDAAASRFKDERQGGLPTNATIFFATRQGSPPGCVDKSTSILAGAKKSSFGINGL
jgi:hypothetical protein